MPNFCIRRSRAARRSPTVSTPSMRIDPASGWSRPRMHFTSTDLPVPEPPMITRLSPVGQSMSTSPSTRLRPNDFLRPRTDIFGIAMRVTANRLSSTEEGCGDHVGRLLADPLRPAARVVAMIAAHQRHDEAEYRRLHQTRNNIVCLEVLLSSIYIGLRIEAELVHTDQISAKDADDVGDENQHRQGDQPSEEAWQHEIA